MKSYPIFFLFLLFGCRQKQSKKAPVPFTEFVFSVAAMNQNYSMKFTDADTVFIETRFPSSEGRFYAALNDSTREKLNFILDTLRLSRFDSSYEEDNSYDATSYKFCLTNDTFKKTVVIYGDGAPSSLYSVADWIDSLAATIAKHPMARHIDFGDLSGIVIPSPPPPGPND